MNLLEMKMPLGEAALTSVIGIATVLVILAIIAVLIICVSKVIRGFESKLGGKKSDEIAVAPAAPVETAAPAKETMTGELKLIGTDEKTAAIIMAIVSNESGIPLNRLSFKSIKLMEE